MNKKEAIEDIQKLGKGQNSLVKSFTKNGGISAILSMESVSKADASRSALANLLEAKGQMMFLGANNSKEADAQLSAQANMAHAKGYELRAEGGVVRDDEKAKVIMMNLAKEDMVLNLAKDGKARA